jgi:hypothetical protein
MKWQQHYSSFENNHSSEEPIQFDQTLPLKSKTKPKKRKPKDIDWYAAIQHMAYLRAETAKEEKRALKIKQIKPTTINASSLSFLIFQVLSTAIKPQHINDIITNVETLGWKSTSQYHKYNQFQHTLSDHYYMFEKVGVATFRIREAFSGKKSIIQSKPRIAIATNTKIASMKDVVEDIVKKYESITPAQVHYVLWTMLGIWCSYSTVRRALQDDRFVKNDRQYGLHQRSK